MPAGSAPTLSVVDAKVGCMTSEQVHIIVASQLRPGDLIVDGAAIRAVGSVRVQGAPAEAVIELLGVPERRHYPATATVTVSAA